MKRDIYNLTTSNLSFLKACVQTRKSFHEKAELYAADIAALQIHNDSIAVCDAWLEEFDRQIAEREAGCTHCGATLTPKGVCEDDCDGSRAHSAEPYYPMIHFDPAPGDCEDQPPMDPWAGDEHEDERDFEGGFW